MSAAVAGQLPAEPVAVNLMATIPRGPSDGAPLDYSGFGGCSAAIAPPVTTVLPAAEASSVSIAPVRRVSSVAMPPATTVRYVAPTTTVHAQAPTILSPTVGTFGGLPYTFSNAPLNQSGFAPDPLMMSAASHHPPIGIPGGFDFKYTGPDASNPFPFDGSVDHTAEYSGLYGPDEPGSPPPPAPPPPQQLREADQYDALAASHERQVELLEHQEHNPQNLERQIHELLEGQRALRKELDDVKATVSMNYRDLEVLRREAEQHHANQAMQMSQPMGMSPMQQPYDYYDQGMSGMHDRDMTLPMQGQDPHYGGSPMGPGGMGMGMGPPSQSGLSQTQRGMGGGGQSMPPRNLGYENSASGVLDTLSRVKDTLHGHATTLHGHATRTMKSMRDGQDGSGGDDGSSSAKMKLCGKACP